MKRWSLLVMLVCAAQAGQAQVAPIPELVPLPKPATGTKTFALRWMKPDVIAHLLAPKDYAMPKGNGLPASSHLSQREFEARVKQFSGLDFELPTGLESWKPLAKQNAIEARGTEAALGEFGEMLGLLEEVITAPLEQVEIEATLYHVDNAAWNNGKMLSPSFESSGSFIDPARQRAVFNALLKAGQGGKIGETQRVTARNNQTVGIEVHSRRSLTRSDKTTKGKGAAFLVDMIWSLQLFSHINGDGIITLGISPNVTQKDSLVIKSAIPQSKNQEIPQSVATVRDGDAILFDPIAGQNAKQKQRWIWLLTARQVHQDKLPTIKKTAKNEFF